MEHVVLSLAKRNALRRRTTTGNYRGGVVQGGQIRLARNDMSTGGVQHLRGGRRPIEAKRRHVEGQQPETIGVRRFARLHVGPVID
jgi:hypothetical protein